MKKLVFGSLSSLVLLLTVMPAKAEIQPAVVAQSQSTIEQMFRQQRVLTDEMKSLMAQMKVLMAEVKALTAEPSEKPITMGDLYKQQQILAARVDALIGRTRFDTIAPRATTSGSVQEVYQQQVEMMAEMKEMMAEIKRMVTVYRGRVTDLRQ